MAKYRIPFYGALLIEAESEHEAERNACMWTASVCQMTQGVEVQECIGILAAFISPKRLSPEKLEVREVTKEYGEKKKQLEELYGGLPQRMAEKFTNYFVGEQMWFEQFENPLPIPLNQQSEGDAN